MRSGRLLLLIPVLLTAACGDLSHLRENAPPIPRLLNAKDSRTVAHAWRKANFGSEMQGFTVESDDPHPPLTNLIEAYQLRTGLPKQPDGVGIPVLIDTTPDPGVSIQIAPRKYEYQFTNQQA